MIPILLYHSIGEDFSGPLGPYTISPSRFAEHMKWITERGFTTLTVSGLQQALDRGSGLPRRPIVISFDDGLADFVTGALPILAAHGHASTMFVTTAGTWPSSPRGLAGRRTMSRREVFDVHEAGVEVASHGHLHHQLDLRSRRAVGEDLRTSKELLEDLVQGPVTSFAYPHGYNRAATRTSSAMRGSRPPAPSAIS